ncbi:MAG: site-specific DNA-methyltransferase [Candidatus Peribacteraceae bacterium]|nr:site-specific DNA-methyltransferase [Candidatus Peribacteraceae bacterium]
MPTLDWIGKQAVVNHDKDVPFRLLKRDPKLSVGDSQNLIIKGDNLEALKALMPYYVGKVKCVYIDPPYNTGNEGWKYNDNVNSPEIRAWLGKVVGTKDEDFTRSDKWLCMMCPRLNLLHELLAEDGVIFISINEEELASLKFLCDGIFGPTNYMTTFTVKVRHEDRILKGDKDFHEVVEYLLMYRRTPAFKPAKRQRDNSSNEEYLYEIRELTDSPKKQQMGNKEVAIFKPNEFEVIKQAPSFKMLKRINIRGSLKEGNSSGRFYMKHLASLQESMSGVLFRVPDMGNDGRGWRYFLTPKGKRVNGDYFQGVPLDRKDIKEIPFPNYLDFEREFNNVGYEGGVEFRNGKKPVKFIRNVLEMAGCLQDEQAIILDSFAGSGSTGHAVLETNKELGGSRRFILIQMVEDGQDTATKTTAVRIRNVVKGYQGQRGEPVKGTGGGFQFMRLDTTLFDKDGNISEPVTYLDLARYIFFTETQKDLDEKKVKKPYIGTDREKDYCLFFTERGKNIFTRESMKKLPKNDAPKVVYADRCLLSEETLRAHRIVFKQIPYQVKTY